ncbi:MAG: hypothetical protein BTN85_0022 [Candidatus Methanohalarchaeum thermophilum]|uniref:Uncharacterized protein n=1 Tax=Methanohalarchaeum thermophilum TaxID=1903181 RepID=A0A1Q6DT54_METT1|nr:MAG: hypothetical protein BTN85_0022 [Candidatus Methanohalarchaeum thermophilum]
MMKEENIFDYFPIRGIIEALSVWGEVLSGNALSEIDKEVKEKNY